MINFEEKLDTALEDEELEEETKWDDEIDELLEEAGEEEDDFN